MFHAVLLSPYKETDIYGENFPAPPAEIIEGEEEYEVERIVKRQGTGPNRKYLIKWKGYPESENSFEPFKNLKHAQELVDEYNRLHPLKPPKRTKTSVQSLLLALTCPS